MFFNLHHAFTTYVCTMQCIQLKLDFYIKFHIYMINWISYIIQNYMSVIEKNMIRTQISFISREDIFMLLGPSNSKIFLRSIF